MSRVKLKPKDIQVDEEHRHFALLAKGHYYHSEKMLDDCRAICRFLWNKDDLAYVLFRLEQTAAEVLRTTDDGPIEDYALSMEHMDVIMAKEGWTDEEKDIECQVRIHLLLIMQWTLPVDVWLGWPDDKVLPVTDPEDADQFWYQEWLKKKPKPRPKQEVF